MSIESTVAVMMSDKGGQSLVIGGRGLSLCVCDWQDSATAAADI